MAKIDKTFSWQTVTYKYNRANRKWQFNCGEFTLIQACGGRTIAEKVAHVVAGAIKRTKENKLDNLARMNIQQIVGRKNSQEN